MYWCETSMWALVFGGQRRSLARSRARWLAKLASKGAETAHKVKIPPTRTRNQMVASAGAAGALDETRGVAPDDAAAQGSVVALSLGIFLLLQLQ